MLSFFPRNVLDESLDLIESVSGGFPTYSYQSVNCFGLRAKLMNPEGAHVYFASEPMEFTLR